MMVLNVGLGWCTGGIVNNTAVDGKPYILSAYHCLADFTPDLDLWRFDFNYESDSCVNPEEEPSFNSITGCVIRSRGIDSDFMLMELNEQIPVHFNVYFSGWDRSDNYTPEQTAIIHHPSADIKKVSVDLQTTEIFPNIIHWTEGYTTTSKSHYKAFFDQGIYEPGSSGAPLFDPKGRIIAQLHGGVADCSSNYGYCGRFNRSWDWGDTPDTRLLDWLDPLNTGTDTLDGTNHPQEVNTFGIRGIVRDPKGTPMEGVEIYLEGDISIQAVTDETGQFSFNQVPRSGNHTVHAIKNINPKNGVSALDLLLIQKHILLIQPFSEAYQVLASDATGNGELSASDLLILQKLLLDKISFLPGVESWVFEPAIHNITDPEGNLLELDLLAIKIGDVNNSADPDQ
jgi:hypothetical protein